MRLEAREPDRERIQIETERAATESTRLDQHGAATTERICHLAAWRREGFDQAPSGARMQARWIAVKAVHVVAHAAFGVHAQAAANHGGQLLRPFEPFDAPAHVRQRSPLPRVLRLGSGTRWRFPARARCCGLAGARRRGLARARRCRLAPSACQRGLVPRVGARGPARARGGGLAGARRLPPVHVRGLHGARGLPAAHARRTRPVGAGRRLLPGAWCPLGPSGSAAARAAGGAHVSCSIAVSMPRNSASAFNRPSQG
jgi:hypothetical protein